MSFGDLETLELREAAYHEAEALVVDPAQLEGREKIEGFAVETSAWLDQGMAISVGKQDGATELRISLADVGTFIAPTLQCTIWPSARYTQGTLAGMYSYPCYLRLLARIR